jgi:hypothetical protein
MAKMAAHQVEPVPPIRKQRSEVPEQLAAIIHRMLAKKPDQRFATPAQVMAAMQPFAAGSDLAGRVRACTQSGPAAVPQLVETSSNLLSRSRSLTHPIVRLRGMVPPRLLSPLGLAAAAGGAALVLLAVILYIRTNYGLVKIELSDPAAKVEVKIDGNAIEINRIREPLRLKAGEHGLEVTSEHFQAVVRSFMVHRGQLEPLRITLPPKQGEEATGSGQSANATQAHGLQPVGLLTGVLSGRACRSVMR